MTQEPWFDVSELERLLQQWIIVKVNLSNRQIIGGAPISVHPAQQFGTGESRFHIDVPGFAGAFHPSRRPSDRAIISSSSVRMTRTLARLASAEITGAFCS